MANPDLAPGALQKPAKGSARTQKLAVAKARLTHEDTEKAKVRKRDGAKACRLVARCEYLRNWRCETAHLDDKGMGGDPSGEASRADCMLRTCFQHHQGPFSLHSKHLRVEYPDGAWDRRPDPGMAARGPQHGRLDHRTDRTRGRRAGAGAMNPPLLPDAAPRYLARTVEELGVVRNPRMWIGHGWLYCVGCRSYQFHVAYSHPGTSDCYEVCRTCARYYERGR